MLDTDQLRSFMAIVDTGSFTRAADRVHKTQSAVSMHIRRLEEQLGRPLFVKNGRGVRLSGDGDRLVDFAREMLRIEASALMEVGQKGLAGHVRLGIPDDYAEVFMPGDHGRLRTQASVRRSLGHLRGLARRLPSVFAAMNSTSRW